jgi:anti-sigma factor RsiW
MNPVQSDELWALLDGELEPDRAFEIEAQMAADPALRRQFEALSATDARWRLAAASAAFMPKVLMPVQVGAQATGVVSWLPALVVAAGILIFARIVLKLAGSDAWILGVPLVSLALLIVGVTGFVRIEQRAVVAAASR